MGTELVVGIDLGTTNSLVGTVREGRVHLVATADGDLLLPSVVGVGPDGRVLVGRKARNRRLLDPAGTVRSIKRRMGEDVRVHVGSTAMTPPEVSALILGALLDAAERDLGARPARAVITVPAWFADHQRQATLDAAELAGCAVERLVNEPTAAAVAHTTGQEALVLVYDLGGGTFDVSILERDEGFMEVRASQGDTRLGGDDIDAALAEHVLLRLAEREAAAVRADAHAMARLAEAVERAKIALSARDEVRIHEPYLTGEGASAVNLDLVIRHGDLDEIARPWVERTLTCIDTALRDARVTAADLDRVVLVGGASRMRLVAEMVAAHLDVPAQLADEPDRTVAHGAALLAGRAAGAAVDEVLVDITPFTLAAGVVDDDDRGLFGSSLTAAPVIPRGTVVPVERTSTYATMFENQPTVDVPIAQGEAERLEDNQPLGAVSIEDLPPSPAQSPVDVTFRLDLSGVLHVTATHRPSGQSATTTIRNGPSRLTAQRREVARARIEALRAVEVAPPEPAAGSATLDPGEERLARSLVRRAERSLEGELDAALRERLSSARAAVCAAIEGVGDLGDAVEALTEALYEAY
ncbi:MAG: Hsp70 family protein [Sandaracinaceae bacterium]|nr:Hsp70 family protein [Sandaracinaceae bacterium]